jgi:CDP-diacylglycerol--glycerol-3-phosphate 3-phosphatidyltransferase
MVSYIKARCEGVNVPCKSGILQRPERLILLLLGLLLGPRLMIWILSFLTIFSWFTVAQRLFEASRYGEKKDV